LQFGACGRSSVSTKCRARHLRAHQMRGIGCRRLKNSHSQLGPMSSAGYWACPLTPCSGKPVLQQIMGPELSFESPQNSILRHGMPLWSFPNGPNTSPTLGLRWRAGPSFLSFSHSHVRPNWISEQGGCKNTSHYWAPQSCAASGQRAHFTSNLAALTCTRPCLAA